MWKCRADFSVRDGRTSVPTLRNQWDYGSHILGAVKLWEEGGEIMDGKDEGWDVAI